jgi:hypothetical protein
MTKSDVKRLVAEGYDRIADKYFEQFGRSRARDAKLAELEHFPKRLNRGDSLFIANQIQESYWQEASMDGKALLGRSTQASS